MKASLPTSELCEWCHVRPVGGRDQKFCGRKCRQAAYRVRRLGRTGVIAGPGLPPGALFAYFDPPYLGLAHYYKDEPTYAGEVDHRRLIFEASRELEAGTTAGFALSCSAKSLPRLLPLMPPGTRQGVWLKARINVPSGSRGIHSAWEPLLVAGGRPCRPAAKDWLYAACDVGGTSKLTGRKPLAFCAWLFDMLGMVPGDRMVDVYPGSNAVGRAWSQVSREYSGDGPSLLPGGVRRPFTPSRLEAPR